MGQGQGSVTVNQKAPIIPPPGPPFALNSADNGLMVDLIAGKIQLGQDPFAPPFGNPARLIRETDIPLNGFGFRATGIGGSPLFLIDDVTNAIRNEARSWQAGNFLGAGNSTTLFLDDVNAFLQFASFGSRTLLLDVLTDKYQIGDIDLFGNGNVLSIDNANQRWEIGRYASAQNLLLNFPGAGIGLSFFDSAGNNPFLLPDPGIGGIAFISAPDFSTQLSLADAGNSSTATLGDVAASTTGMIALVDVPNSDFRIQNTALNSIVVINNVNGFTGTVTPPLTITVNGGIVTNVA